MELSCNKQKDSEEFPTIGLRLEQIDGTESCVMSTDTAREATLEAMLEMLAMHQPCKWQDWVDATGLGDDFFKFYADLKPKVEKGADGLWRVKE